MTSVSFSNQLVNLGTATNAGGHNWQLSAWGASNGTYILTVVAQDNVGNSASNSITITNNAMPTVSITNPITSPTNLASFPEVTNVLIQGVASDIDGTITNVSLYDSTNGFIASTNNAQFSLVWTNRRAGYYSVVAVATDDRGASSISPICTFKVTSTNPPPAVQITYPTNGATLPPGSDITITAAAAATNPATVTNVEFFVDGVSIGNDPEAPYSITKCCWKPGTYVLIATALDSFGSFAVSDPVTITISQEPTSAQGYWDQIFGQAATSEFYGAAINQNTSITVSSNGTIYTANDELDPLVFTTNVMDWHVAGQYPGNEIEASWVWLYADGTNVYGSGDLGGSVPFNPNAYGIVRWDTISWSPVGDGLTDDSNDGGRAGWGPGDTLVYAITKIGGDIYVGGTFDSAGGIGSTLNTNIQKVARLDSQTGRWNQVGNGITNGAVYAIAQVNGQIYIGGNFTNAGGDPNANYIARLDNNVWTNVGSGLVLPDTSSCGGYFGDLGVRALQACGDNLFVGGNFISAGGNTNANGVAVWDGKNWGTLGSGVAPADAGGGCSFVPQVNTLAVRGNQVFVGGSFSGPSDGTVAAKNIAMATWDDVQKTWTWSGLDSGMEYGEPYVTRCLVVDGASPDAYDLYISGSLYWVGSDLISSSLAARWRVGYPAPPALPVITITNPANETIFSNNPSSIEIDATATNVSSVTFYVDNVSIGGSGNGGNSYAATWTPTPGSHSLTAVAVDASGLKTRSKPVFVTILGGNTVTAVDDFYVLSVGDPPATLNVLSNDSTTNGHPLRVVGVARGGLWLANANLGTPEVSFDGSSVMYALNPNVYGTDHFLYYVTDGVSTNSAYVTVKARIKPLIAFERPVDGTTNSAGATIPFNGLMFDYDSSITNFTVYVNGNSIYQSTPASINYQANPTNFFFELSPGAISPQTTYAYFTNNWTTTVPGYYTFLAAGIDSYGYSNASSPVTIVLTNQWTATNVLTAAISNLPVSYTSIGTPQYTIVRNGLFDLQGTAWDSNTNDLVSYEVLIHPPGDPNTVLANVTPQQRDAEGFHEGRVSGDLGICDFSQLQNGVYDLELLVKGGGSETNAVATIRVESELKIGQFSFSEQDLTLPVNGIPLTVTRTYNSLNPDAGPFGTSWNFALNDMDVQLDDQREDITLGDNNAPLDDIGDIGDNGLPRIVNMRTGGGWDVTLTLPNGQRTTFQFSYYGNVPTYHAQWTAPTGVHATLQMLGDDRIILGYNGLSTPVWATSTTGLANAPFDNQDVPGWVLTTTTDGTKYYITRQSTNNIVIEDPNNPGRYISARVLGPPKLTKIQPISGDSIVIGDTGIFHYDLSNHLTRSILFDHDSQGRIVALHDPNGGSNGLPAVKYLYDNDNNNLVQVLKLMDRKNGIYVTNSYRYDNPAFPHYITGIINGDGVPVARNFYDDAGRLTGVQDADGNTTQFIHNTTNNMEVVIDRLNRTNTLVYDLRGNVIARTNALGQVTLSAFDGNNNKTNEIVYANGQPYATNNFAFDGNSLLLSATDPLNHSNVYAYNGFAEVTVSTDARGNSTTNFYDNNTGDLLGTSDALGNTTTNVYSNGLLIGSRDAVGTLTTNYFDGSGNLTANATLSASGVILSTNTFGYDLNGNRTNSTVWRKVGGTWTAATTTYILDGQNRVVQSIEPDGGTNTVVYDAVGRQQATIDKLGRTTSYTYDFQGRLIQTTYPDLTTETSAFDAVGNRTNSVDRAGRTTTYVYDALNRPTQTIYPDTTSARTIYDDLGRVKFSVDARGTTNAFGYDLANHRVSATNALGTAVQMVSTFGFDATGNQTYFTNAAGAVTTNVFDVLNRQVQVLYPDGTKVSTGFDADSRRVAETNQDSTVTLFGYDGAGRLTSVTNAFGKAEQMITRYDFDEAGNLLRQIDALNRTNAFIYDSLFRRISHTMPDGNLVERFGYDLVGNLIYQTNFNGAVITNQYDLMNRLTNRASVNGYKASFGYSATGQRTNMTDVSGATGYTYDSQDRLTNKVVSWTGGPTLSLSYRFDANGNLTNLWSGSSGGVTNVYQFDALDRLTNALANGSAAAGYGFDSVGNLQRISYGNGVTNQFQYDALNRLTNAVWKLNASTVASFYYQLGLAGNRTNLSENVNGTSRTYAWTFDPLYRLKQETLGGGSSGTLSYGFDVVGNRTNRTVTGSLSLTNQAFTFNTNDWLASDGFDNNGNTTNSSGNFYQYDALNHATNVNSGSVLMGYDGDGNRVKKTVGGTTTYYLLDDRNPSGYVQVLEEWTSTGTPTLNKVYNYGLQLISQRQPGVSTNYFVFDGHGSTRVLADIAGTVVNAFTFDAYGNLIASNAAPQTVYLYAGQQFDPDLGVYYLRTRLSNPGTGRFLTSDEADGDEERPTSLHRYTLCENDPVNNVDPNGTDIGEVLAVADIGGMLAQISNPVAGRVQQRAVAVANPRPSTAVFWAAYPNYDKYRQEEIWQKVIGGSLGEWAGPEKHPPTGLNSCATRVSRGINYSGKDYEIPSGIEGANINNKSVKYHDVAGDGKRYIISAGNMNKYLRKKWGNPPDKTLKTAQEITDYINSLPKDQCAVFATRPERPQGQGHSGVLKKDYKDPYVLDEVEDGPIDVWLLPK